MAQNKKGQLTNTGKTHIKKGEHLSLLTEFKKGQIPWNKGLVGYLKGRISPMLGKNQTEETKEKIKENCARYWLGKKLSKEHREKLSFNHADFRGKKSPLWKGGKSGDRRNWEYNSWHKFVLKRDNYICQICNKTGKLHVHHLKKWVNYPELRYKVSNGQT